MFSEGGFERAIEVVKEKMQKELPPVFLRNSPHVIRGRVKKKKEGCDLVLQDLDLETRDKIADEITKKIRAFGWDLNEAFVSFEDSREGLVAQVVYLRSEEEVRPSDQPAFALREESLELKLVLKGAILPALNRNLREKGEKIDFEILA